MQTSTATAITKERRIITDMLAMADVTPNGDKPWDIQVHDESFYGRVLSGGSLALGETYMDGLWDCEHIDQFIFHVQRAELSKNLKPNLQIAAYYLKNKIINPQSKSKAFNLKHYDIGNELYKRMLDKRMVYTCGYWANATDLDGAQEAKLEMVCRKLGLKPGMKVLDIGCGWGSFMKYAAEKYGVSCVGVTISQSQVDLGKELCAGLPIEFRLQDYRDITGEFDAVMSLGMFEHVGPKNYRAYMEVAARVLKDDGMFLLHTLGMDNTNPQAATDPWIAKYIFPGGVVPTSRQVTTASQDLFVIEDWHNFGAYYDTTLTAWERNFEASWPEIKGDYDERFFRMWKYYLLSCAGSSRARAFQLWQIVFSKKGVLGGYIAPR